MKIVYFGYKNTWNILRRRTNVYVAKMIASYLKPQFMIIVSYYKEVVPGFDLKQGGDKNMFILRFLEDTQLDFNKHNILIVLVFMNRENISFTQIDDGTYVRSVNCGYAGEIYQNSEIAHILTNAINAKN